jgi:hypothetical protein
VIRVNVIVASGAEYTAEPGSERPLTALPLLVLEWWNCRIPQRLSMGCGF